MTQINKYYTLSNRSKIVTKNLVLALNYVKLSNMFAAIIIVITEI